MNDNFRKLSLYETNILEKLFSRNFPGNDVLEEQMSSCLVKEIAEYNDNSGSVELKVTSSLKAKVTNRIPVFATIHDSDGVLIEIFLHVVNGEISELEIVKADNSPIKQKINSNDMKVFIDQEVIHE